MSGLGLSAGCRITGNHFLHDGDRVLPAEEVRRTIIVPENETGFLNTLWQRLFLPGTLKNAPCCLNQLLVNFREEPSGIGRFCRLEVPTGDWLSFVFLIETGWIARNRPTVSNNPPSFDFLIETGPVGPLLSQRAIGQFSREI